MILRPSDCLLLLWATFNLIPAFITVIQGGNLRYSVSGAVLPEDDAVGAYRV